MAPLPVVAQSNQHQSDPIVLEPEQMEKEQGDNETVKESTMNEEQDDLISEENKSSRGRPRKNLELSASEFKSFIMKELRTQFVKINSQVKAAVHKDRTDTVRTSLIRLIKKIPYICLVKLSRRADYKAKKTDIEKYQKAYAITIKQFGRLLNICDIDHSLNSEKPEGFTCLYFPKDKVIATAFDKQKAYKLV